MEDWKTNPAFVGGTTYEESEVNGTELKFYPISVNVMFKLRRIAAPLAKAISTLFQPDDKDLTVIERTFSDDGEGGKGKELIQEAISPQLAKLRQESRASAITDLIEAVTDERNALVIGRVIVDSLRDDFPRKMKDSDVQDFVSKLEAPRLVELLKGVMAANGKVLGPLEDRVLKAKGAQADQEAEPETEMSTAG